MTGPVADARSVPRPRRAGVLVTFVALLAVAFVGFLALGVWQVQRMAWKHDLIARVNARVHAEPVPAPSRAQWPRVTDASDGYRRVSVAGEFVPGKETRTQAVTAYGAGSWVLAPLKTDAGDYVLVNRGFVPMGQTAGEPPQGRVVVTGLLRISEPGGGFLRRNDPAQGRWHSRDVAAIAQAHGLPADRVAPFFMDEGLADEAGAASDAWPRGGLTVVKFRDSHLSYAVTWFGMALLALAAGVFLIASERRLRHDRRR